MNCDDHCHSAGGWSDNPDSFGWQLVGLCGASALLASAVARILVLLRRYRPAAAAQRAVLAGQLLVLVLLNSCRGGARRRHRAAGSAETCDQSRPAPTQAARATRQPAWIGWVSALTNSSSWLVVQHSNAWQCCS